jgi:peptidoglycan/LPS O-acetylase OafA/YrhL
MQKLPAIKYFKNLNGLRFFAAFAVIIGHSQHIVHQYTGYFPYAPWANKLASFGVDFFFVLSGFLITYLMLQEIEKTGTIAIRDFYRRRALRIFPLYFLVGIFGLVTGSFWLQQFNYLSLFDGQYSDYMYHWADFFRNLLFLGTFSINFQTFLGFQNPVSSFSVGHFWSIAVEEQFYLIWAPMMFLFRRHVLAVIVVCVTVGLVFSLLPSRLFSSFYEFQYYFTLNRFWHFGIGAALAWSIQYVRMDMLVSRFLPSKSASASNWIVTFLQVCFLIPALYYLFGSYYEKETVFVANAAVALLIIAVALADQSVLSFLGLENQSLKYLGKISYGIYMFHLFAIYLVYFGLKSCGFTVQTNLFLFLLPCLSTVLSVALAAVSYAFFEERFLRLRRK